MKGVWTAALAIALGNTPEAASTEAPRVKGDPDAESVCASGQRSARYEHASDSCWVAFSAALAREQPIRALAVVRSGCERYARADQCLLISELAADQRERLQLRHGAASRITPDALRRAASRIGVWDVDDAESAVRARERGPGGAK